MEEKIESITNNCYDKQNICNEQKISKIPDSNKLGINKKIIDNS